MNKKVEKYFLTTAIVLLVSCAYFWMSNLVNKSVLTDSGFDVGYSSSGGSSSSSSSYSSSSSSSSSSGGSDFDFSNPWDVVLFILIFVMCTVPSIGILIFIIYLFKTSKNVSVGKRMSEEEAREIIPEINLNEFLQKRVQDYIKIQNDWSNFNYDGLKENLTDELYNQYCMQLKTLETKNERNIMSDFEQKDVMLNSLEKVNGRYEATIELLISFFDYIEQDGKTVRGSSDKKVIVRYTMIFVSSSDEVVNKCPSCGAELGDNNTEKCPYCHNVISRLTNKWVLSKKMVLTQTNE